MAVFKNKAGQFIYIFAWDNLAQIPATGDAANISVYFARDGGASDAADNSVAEVDATNMKGMYELELTQAEANADVIGVSGSSSTSDVDIDPLYITTQPGIGTDDNHLLSADDWQSNLELQYDGTGLIGDAFPARQDQVAAISGALTLPAVAESRVLDDGAETNAYTDTAIHNGVLHTITDNDNSDPGIQNTYRFDIADAPPSHVHLHGWYQDGAAPFTNSCLLQAYDWAGAAFETIETLIHATAEQEHNPILLSRHASTTANGPASAEGIVDIRFVQAAQDNGSGSTMNVDHLTVQYVNPTLTAAEVNAEMLDVLDVDTFAELSADPGAAPTITGMLKLLYMALRNKVVTTANEQTIHQDDGTELLESDLTDIANTSFTKDKMRSPD